MVYWLVEIFTTPRSAPCYYTSPGIWGSAVDLATKFHTEKAARTEAKHLQIPAMHEVVATQHEWVSP